MEKALKDYIIAQRKEAEEFSKQPGCWMGSMVHPSDTKYWNERVPTGTLKEFKRIQLEEDAYYCNADAYSKSFARSIDYSKMTDEELDLDIKEACEHMEHERKWYEEQEKQAQEEEAKLASTLGIDVPTLQRWLKQEAA
jgi:hypothetical protein